MTDRSKMPRTQTDLRANTVTVPCVRVTVIPPDGRPVDAPLGIEPIIVGTHPDCEVVIVDPRVSRRHCELELTDRGVVLKDLASRNGTFAGGLAALIAGALALRRRSALRRAARA
jgi:pSer/pThr/pTyr-binding forkhead associated (FHA) protein